MKDELDHLSDEELIDLTDLYEAERALDKVTSIDNLYPDNGPLSRQYYPKHIQFFEAGKTFMERGAIAGNRTGKTTMSCYETTLHLTGDYPEWWDGRRFGRPVDWWAASDTGETTRDILQLKLMGPEGEFGTGMIKKDRLIKVSMRRGIAGAVDMVAIRHKSGGISRLGFKSYDQGWKRFQGTKKDGIQLDEEPPPKVYTECITRLTATEPGEDSGVMLCTFTPLGGMSMVVLTFLNESSPTRFVITLGMKEVPHLSKDTVEKLIQSYPEHERQARMDGTPQLGSGAIYPIPEVDIVVPDFPIPEHWLRGYSLDVGWKRTSAGHHAWDRENDVIYRYSEHYRGQAEPSVHAQAIKAKGEWIQGVVDPGARGRSQADGQRIIEIYQKLGLKLTPAKNAVEAGIYELYQRLSSGRYKVFASCTNWIIEKRLYRRDEDGKIVKENDHAMDDSRYFVMSGLEISRTKPQPPKQVIEFRSTGGMQGGEWMG